MDLKGREDGKVFIVDMNKCMKYLDQANAE